MFMQASACVCTSPNPCQAWNCWQGQYVHSWSVHLRATEKSIHTTPTLTLYRRWKHRHKDAQRCITTTIRTAARMDRETTQCTNRNAHNSRVQTKDGQKDSDQQL